MKEVLIKPAVVEKAVQDLLEERIHPHFAGYLCLKWTVAQERVEEGSALKPDFKTFFDRFMKLPGGPRNKPYLRPFWNEEASREKVWMNPNIAGSYSPATVVRSEHFMAVAEVDQAEGTYSLREKHSEHARDKLLFEARVPVVPLAVFFYRDFSFEFENEPGYGGIVEIFRGEFGYPVGAKDEEFNKLYRENWRIEEELVFESR